MNERKMQATVIEDMLSMNQATQWTAFPSPMVRIVSFRRRSFSWTTDLTVMDAA